jgi:hypothetical protein
VHGYLRVCACVGYPTTLHKARIPPPSPTPGGHTLALQWAHTYGQNVPRGAVGGAGLPMTQQGQQGSWGGPDAPHTTPRAPRSHGRQ